MTTLLHQKLSLMEKQRNCLCMPPHSLQVTSHKSFPMRFRQDDFYAHS